MITSNQIAEALFEGWCILEIMGHRRLGGYIRETNIAGQGFIRLDTFNDQSEVEATQFYNPSSIYIITPTTWEIAIGFGLNHRPTPIQKWELPKAKAPVVMPPFIPDDKDDFEYSESSFE